MQAERTYNVNVIAQDVDDPGRDQKRCRLRPEPKSSCCRVAPPCSALLTARIHACLWWWDRVRFMTCERPAIMPSA